MISRPRILVNAVSAKMGGAVKYIEAIAETIGRRGSEFEWDLIVPPALGSAVRSSLPRAKVFEAEAASKGDLRRLWFDQWTLRGLVKAGRYDALLSAGNVALLGCRCKQVLLVRNSLFFSELYRKSILPRKPMGTRCAEGLRRAMTLISINSADIIVVPSLTLQKELLLTCPGASKKTVVNLYGVESDVTHGPHRMQEEPIGPPRLFFPALYAEHKDVGTLLEAMDRLASAGVACVLSTPADPRRECHRSDQAMREAAIAERLFRKGAAQFSNSLTRCEMAQEYARAAIVVYPSMVESFGHPLVEAMRAQVPIVAVDVPINREICEDAALYYRAYDGRACADAIRAVLEDPELRRRLITAGSERILAFSWDRHVAAIEELLARGRAWAAL